MIRLFLSCTFLLSFQPLASRGCLLNRGEASHPENRQGRDGEEQKSKGVLAAWVQGYHIPRRIIR